MRGIFGWVFLFLLLAGGAWARVWDVKSDGMGTAPTIQAAIDSCVSGDTVLVAPGTFKGAGNRDIDFTGKAIVVMSLSGPEVTIVDCGGSEGEYHRGFYFHSGEDTTSVLQGFTIRNGYSGEGGAIYCHASSPKMLGNVVTGNFADGSGGGIYCEGTHSIIFGNLISHNETQIMVAAAQNTGSAGTLDPLRLAIAEWHPMSGGNICCIADSSLVDSNTISGGRATWGGAIYCEESSVRVRHNNISENGGAFTARTACFLSGTYSIEENTITDNTAWYDGGGLYCSGGEYRIVSNEISSNRIWYERGSGGGIFCVSGNFAISNNRIIENEASCGGGLFLGGSGTVRNNVISHNWALTERPCRDRVASSGLSEDTADHGGGITISGATSSLVIANNSVTGNYALFGGGISCIGASPEITDNIIASNGAGEHPCGDPGEPSGVGGGIYCSNSSPVVARNTIYENSAGSTWINSGAGAGIYCTSGSSPLVYQNIIAGNQTENVQGVGGICCEDPASDPSIACNDVYDNSNANYGGTLADQTGLNGNFSLDPIFCGAENGEFGLHALSPCAAGQHPGGGDCGLIGALAPACDYLATLLQGYSTSVSPAAVTITWTLAQAGENLTCSVLRAEAEDGEYRELLAPAIARAGLTFTFNDAGFDPGTAYRYRVDVSDSEGKKTLFETGRIVTPSLPLSLNQNFPNPFNPSTTISYYLPQDATVTLAVYDVSGRRVADLVGKAEKKGRHSVTWNGEDRSGSSAASGIYFSRLTAGKETVSKKMILLR
jgi:predicted outer membrane repeat protein